MSNEQDLVNRYEALLNSDNLKVLCGSKSSARKDIQEKILFLKQIINTQQIRDNQNKKP